MIEKRTAIGNNITAFEGRNNTFIDNNSFDEEHVVV